MSRTRLPARHRRPSLCPPGIGCCGSIPCTTRRRKRIDRRRTVGRPRIRDSRRPADTSVRRPWRGRSPRREVPSPRPRGSRLRSREATASRRPRAPVDRSPPLSASSSPTRPQTRREPASNREQECRTPDLESSELPSAGEAYDASARRPRSSTASSEAPAKAQLGASREGTCAQGSDRSPGRRRQHEQTHAAE